jgi:hypothetical protein
MEEYVMVWSNWMNVILGSWLILSPFILGFSSDQATWNNLIVGFLVLVFALISRSAIAARTSI